MRRRLALSLVAITALILVVFGIPLASFINDVERDRLLTSLERDAFIIAGHAKETLNPSEGSLLPSLQPHIADHSSGDARVIVTNKQGLVVAANDESAAVGSSFLNRPEVREALEGNPAVGERSSVTLGEPLVYVAVPVFLGNEVLGVVRISSPQSQIDAAVRDRLTGIALAAAITMLAAVIVSLPIAMGIARPIERLTRRTERLSEGDFSVRSDEKSGPPEVRELAQSFNAMAARLGLLLESQRQFASAVSHQLRTPLTALRLRLEQAHSLAAGTSQDVEEALEASRHEVDRLQSMVEQLLALARLEGKTSQVVTIDVDSVIESRLEMWEPLAIEKGVQLRFSAKSGSHCVALEGALEQIIDNYIDNALTVAPEGSTIDIVVGGDAGVVRISVIDSGPGLSSRDLSRAFERFWRGRHTENSPGSGLGLAIVKQLAVASGGDAVLSHRDDDRGGVVASVELRRKA